MLYPVKWNYTYAKEIPIEAQYLFKKAMEMSSMGKTEGALKYFRQTLFIAPRYSKAHYQMGNYLTNLGQHEEAVVQYEKAIQIDPTLKDRLELRI